MDGQLSARGRRRLPAWVFTAAIATVAGLAGLVAGTLLQSRAILPGAARDFVEVRERGSRFVSPLLECEPRRDSTVNRGLGPLRARLAELIRRARDAGRVSSVAVYFRDLDAGSWFSLDPAEGFVPASLLKVPVMMAVLHAAEDRPGILEAEVAYAGGDEDLVARQTVKPSVALAPGRSYRMAELLRRMIVSSDNNAARLVVDTLSPGELSRTYAELGVSFLEVRGDEDFISVDAYASFFRILYNASYLKREMSERALSLLAAAEYGDGLRAGVPREIPVAHKFGEWRLREEGAARDQLHDCGIVYQPGRPYLICVMTRGADFAPLGGVIADISRAAYEEVRKQASAAGGTAWEGPSSPTGPAWELAAGR